MRGRAAGTCRRKTRGSRPVRAAVVFPEAAMQAESSFGSVTGRFPVSQKLSASAICRTAVRVSVTTQRAWCLNRNVQTEYGELPTAPDYYAHKGRLIQSSASPPFLL